MQFGAGGEPPFMCFRYLITKCCCSPPPPKVSRKPDRLKRKTTHTRNNIPRGNLQERTYFFNYVKHWLKGACNWEFKKKKKSLYAARAQQQEDDEASNSFRNATASPQKKKRAWQAADLITLTSWSVPNISILQVSPTEHHLCPQNMRFWHFSGKNQAVRSPGGDICCKLFKAIQVSKNEWTAACKKLFCLKLPLLISIYTLSSWSLPPAQHTSTGKCWWKHSSYWQSDEKHAPILLFRAVTIDIQDKSLIFYLFFSTPREVWHKRKKNPHKSGFQNQSL